MADNNVKVRVASIKHVANTIKQFDLVPCEGTLPTFTPGAHITVEMNDELKRSYSLTSAPDDAERYQIAVLLEPESRGGSRYMHERLKEGDELNVSQPDNYFALDTTHKGKHLLIAGGIGITPFMSYLPVLEAEQLDFELHYCIRSEEDAAYVSELSQRLGERLFIYDTSVQQRLEVEALIKQYQETAHVYVCGPVSLIDDVVKFGQQILGEERTHFENFGEAASEGDAFEVHFQQSGFSLTIESDTSILQAIEADGRLSVECLCRNGVCGTCETDIVEGEADHRDNYLDDDEKASQETMMICISRSKTPKLILDM
ncbi:PDR/VanB family oxidoreductase [Bacterioplanoides sp.]|uniref:PDR/VanB family oxidoreductase n=1 Tax=Bacterioplanoides sp. TaxID=2066072 RepID=UPI003B5CB3EB